MTSENPPEQSKFSPSHETVTFSPKKIFSPEHDDVPEPIPRTRAEVKSKRVLNRNKRLAYIIAFTHQVGFLTPIWVIFGTDHLHLSLTLSLILGSTGWALSPLFEVPMGAVADKFGRQISLVVGLSFCAVADIALIAFKSFWLLMFFQIFAGIGYALRSGSLEGLLHDTYEAHGDITAYSKVSSRMLVLMNISRVLTIPIGGWLYALSPQAHLSSYTFPYIAMVAAFCIALCCAGMLTEHRSTAKIYDSLEFAPTSTIMHSLTSHVFDTWKKIRANRDVFRVVIFVMMFTVVDEGNWALYQSYFRERDVHLSVSQWIYMALGICTAVGVAFAPRIYRKINVLWAFIVIFAVLVLDVALMHLPLGFALPAMVLTALISMIPLYLYDNAIQNRMDGNHKTTALSIASMGYAVGAVIGVFGIDAFADRIGVFRTQWIFVAYGVVALIVMCIWTRDHGWSVMPIDLRASVASSTNAPGEGPSNEVSIDQIPQLKP